VLRVVGVEAVVVVMVERERRVGKRKGEKGMLA
jgi:hypothetical protein